MRRGNQNIIVGTVVVMIAAAAFAKEEPALRVLAEEDVYSFVSPNNGSGPLWSFGCTCIARMEDTVVVSQMETGDQIPPLSNTRWRLLRRENAGWRMIAEADGYRQREPCPLAVSSEKDVFLYANDSTQPPGTKYGRCEPYLWRFIFSGDAVEQIKLSPKWQGETYFTDHSYRGFAADRDREELLMLNIDAHTSTQHACLLSAAGATLANGSITFPIRACYPQVALIHGAVHVLAVSDIVEPVEAWRQYKFDQTRREWDYVFRILYYAHTPDLRRQNFGPPIEIANVDKTGGHIGNQDLWISPDGDAYILYTQREVQSELLRDKFFPGASTVDSLYLAVVRNGAVVSRRTLIEGSEERTPGVARFHATPAGRIYAMVYVSGTDGGNKLLQAYPPAEEVRLIPVPLSKPFTSFSLASVRAGNIPSYTMDVLGHRENNKISYAAVRIEP